MIDLKEKPFFLSPEQEAAVQARLGEMTLEEKIGQLFFIISPNEQMVDLADYIQKYKPGGVMYRPDSEDSIQRQIKTIQDASSIPLFIAANLEAGGNGLIHEGTWFANPMGVAATDKPEAAYNLGKVAGSEAHQVGANMAFAPIVDIDMNFRNPITNVRTYGSDAKCVLTMAHEQIKGFSDSHIISCIKHFPGDGVDERDQHLLSSVNDLSADDWMASYGQIYQSLIDQGVSTVMIGHIMQPAWERKLNPAIADEDLKPASSSKLLIDGLLRQELGFNGLAITDATPMIGYNTAMARKDLLPATINAGIDMILFNKNIDEDYAFIREAIADGRISAERLDQAVTRILATKLAQGVADSHFANTYQADEQTVNYAAHHALAADLAKDAVSLVKDRDHLLPITPERYPRIRLYVLGDSDEGGFKEGGKVGPLFKEKLEAAGFEVSVYDSQQLNFMEIFEGGIADLENQFDLALYVANVETASNQTTTRLNWIQLMAADAPWFLKSIPTVFVSTANPYHLFDIPSVSTFVNAYTGNPETIDAVLRKLQGKEDFLGHSPVDPFCGRFETRL